MHELANELIKKVIEEVVDEWDFEVRRKKYPDKCPYYTYTNGEKCHNMEKLNCLTCLCPDYDRTIKEGGCKINNPKGKYIEGVDGKIWDCSDCDFPHTRENVIKLLEGLFK